jgi:hypothetical protein
VRAALIPTLAHDGFDFLNILLSVVYSQGLGFQLWTNPMERKTDVPANPAALDEAKEFLKPALDPRKSTAILVSL